MTPEYWEEAKRELAKRDPVLRKLIRKFPDAELGTRGDAFKTLARSITGQQISVKAANSIWGRFAECAKKVNAKNVVGLVFVAAFAPDEGERLGEVSAGSKDSVLNSALVPLQYPTGSAPAASPAARSPT